MARDAVLLDEILENMNASMLPADQYNTIQYNVLYFERVDIHD